MKILIVHQRKSASTSLIYTLKEILNYKINNFLELNDNIFYEYDINFFSNLEDNTITSLHIFPSSNNIELIKQVSKKSSFKIIILLRKPEEALEAIFRHLSFNGSVNLTKNKDISTLKYHEDFFEKWNSVDIENKIKIYFEDLVLYQNKNLKNILDYLDLNIKINNDDLHLLKKRYTGNGIKKLLKIDKSISEKIIENITSCDQIYTEYDDPWNQTDNLFNLEKSNMVCFLIEYCVKNLGIKKCCDLGCGLGYLTNKINNIKDCSCIGFDISKTCIEKAKKKFGDFFYNLSISDIYKNENFNNFNFDLVLMLDLTWYILDEIENFKQYLKKNFKDKFIIHVLSIPENQKYGNKYFKNLEDLLTFFSFEYIYSGHIYNKNGKYTYFLARI